MGRSGRRSFLRRCVGQVLCGLLLLQSSPAFTDSGTGRERQHWVHGTLSDRPSGGALSFAPEPAPVEPAAAPAVRSAALTPPDPPARPVRAAASQPPAFPRDGNGSARPEEKSPEPAAPEKAQTAPTDSSRPPLPPGVKDLRSGRSLVPAALIVKAGSTSAIPLQTGWNLVSLPRQAGDPSPASVFGGAASRVFAYDACDTADPWKVWDPSNPSGNDLTAVTPQMGLWAEVPAALTLPVAGSEPATTTIHLCPGWNLIGAPFSQSRSVAGALAPIAGKYTRVFGFDAADPSDPWEVFDVSVPSWADTLQTFEPGKGYWLFATAAADLVLSNQVTGPVVQIASPLDLAEVTTLTPVTGTVTGDLLRSWTLAYRAVGDTQWTSIGSGTGPVTNAVLGTFDPTLLLNGPYQIQLTATDANNLEQSAQIDVNVEGQQKIGNFTLTFQDLDVPLSGLPIQILRTYDSRDKRQGDFGIGWTLDIHQGSYKNNRQPGEGWQFASGFVPCQFIRESLGHQTTIRLSDREIYRFKLSLSRGVPTQGGCFAQAGFDFVDGPVPGATLAILGGTQVLYQNGGGEVVDPGSFEIYEPKSVRLTTRDGRIFDLTLQQGVTRLEDRNGNQLAITPNGITHSSGRAVTFERDGQGRITKITDPEGNSLTYEYDAAGNLITVADRLQQTTRFTYDPSHLLLDIQDARGITPVRNEYDANGRLLRTTDAFGKTIELSHDLADHREVVTDRLGHSRVLEYDVRGNVIRETNALGKVTSRTFDDHDQLLSETDPLNQITANTYDNNRNLTSVRDPLAHTKSYTYNVRGQVLTMTNARGKTTANVYDAAGNLLSTTDPLGNVATNTYDSRGRLLTHTDPEGAVTQYGYDAFGNIIREVDPLGTQTTATYNGNGDRLTRATQRTTTSGVETLIWSYEYDRLGRLMKTTDPDGTSIQSVYDPLGNLVDSIDKLGHHTTFTFDEMGRRTETRHPDGTADSNTYDAEGRRVTFKNRGGRTMSYVYDPVGRLLTTILPDTAVVSNTYDDAGHLIATTDARNNTTVYTYDAAGRRTKVQDTLGHETVFSYDADGNLSVVTDPRNHTTTFEYDNAGRLLRILFPDGSSTQTGYSRSDLRISQTDQAGLITRFGYDALGRLTSVTDALNQITRYVYDEQGNRISQIDANGHETKFEYDKLGRQTKRILPGGAAEILTYDAAGNLHSRTGFSGATTQYTYDVQSRLLSRSYPDGTSVSFTYTPTGRRATAVDARGTTSYSYDSRDRLTQLTYPDGRFLTYAYDLQGNRTSLTAQIGAVIKTTSYAYDLLSRLQTVTDPNGGLYTYSYDESGNRTSLAYPNGVTTTYSYDALNRLTNLTTKTSAGAIIQSYDYTLGPAGNRLRIDEQDGTSRNYSYDNLYRLTDEHVTSAGNTVFRSSFAYDPVGNRTSQARTQGANSPQTIGYTYDSRDRLLAKDTVNYSWDENGNQVSKTGSQGATYSWDAEDRLAQIVLADGTTIKHTYDPDGNRVRTVTTSSGASQSLDFLVDPGYQAVAAAGTAALSQVIAESDGSGAYTFYSRGGNELLGILRPGEFRFYHADGLGSGRILTDSAGSITDQYSYDAFGGSVSRTGQDSNAYQFAGEQIDPGSSLYYLRARWMDPSAGRFTSMDKQRALPRESTTLHRYWYTRADPVNRIDPNGLEDFSLTSLSVASSVDTTVEGIGVGAEAPLVADVSEGLSAITDVASEGSLDFELAAEAETEVAQGAWEEETITNVRAAEYQGRVTGRPAETFRLNGVKFDGASDAGELIEAKGPGYARLFRKSIARFVMDSIRAQVRRQLAAAGGRQIIWHIAEEDAVPVFEAIIESVENASNLIKVVFTP